VTTFSSSYNRNYKNNSLRQLAHQMDGAAAISRRGLLSEHCNTIGGYLNGNVCFCTTKSKKILNSPFVLELWTRVVLPLTQ
jgi:hypothetical protein